jgi:RNA polymerase sigma-70 factor (ECF subfamily)
MSVVAEAMAKLPDAQREVISLRDVEGWSSQEVCDALGISSVNQRVLLHRARAVVRGILEDYFNG